MSIARGRAKVWSVRLWETETINTLGWSEAKWCGLSLAERARKVCAHKLPDWLAALEAERELAKARAKRGS